MQNEISLSKPSRGWTTLQINNFKCNASYIQDVPGDILDAAIASLTKSIPFSLYVEGEGIDTLICATEYTTRIFKEGEEFIFCSLRVSSKELIEKLVNDLEANIDDWVNWFDIFVWTDFVERKKNLKDKIGLVKDLLENGVSKKVYEMSLFEIESVLKEALEKIELCYGDGTLIGKKIREIL